MKKLIILTIISLTASLAGCATRGSEKSPSAGAPQTVSAGAAGALQQAGAGSDGMQSADKEPGEGAAQETAEDQIWKPYTSDRDPMSVPVLSSSSSDDELSQALDEGYQILVDVRDRLYSYYQDKDVGNNEEVTRAIILADDLINRINTMRNTELKASQVASIYDEMSDVMDIFSAINEAQDPRTIDILDLREKLKGSMWIDDEINTYIFDRDGKTMYIALAGDDEPSGGTYSVSFTDEAIRFTFSIPELTTEVKGDVTEFTDNSFKFVDVNTGDAFYLTPVE